MSGQDEEEDARMMAQLEILALDKPEMQKQMPFFKQMRARRRQAEAKWSARFEAFFARHPPLPIPTRRDLSTPLEQAQFEVALKWAQQEFARLRWRGNTVLTGDRPGVAAMLQVLEALPQRPNGARLLLLADWKRF